MVPLSTSFILSDQITFNDFYNEQGLFIYVLCLLPSTLCSTDNRVIPLSIIESLPGLRSTDSFSVFVSTDRGLLREKH